MAKLTNQHLTIRPLEVRDAAALARLLQAQPPEYVQFFHPFDFDEATVTKVLAERQRDVMTGLYWAGEVVGFYMLRGWDAGYEVPSYGVLVDEKFRGCGLTSLTIRMAKIVCKMRGAPRLMLKVHPDNARAKVLYEKARFRKAGVEADSNHLIYYFDLDGWTAKF